MIDPRKVTNFDRTHSELEEFLLFSIVVAGKNAFVQAGKLEEFLRPRHDDWNSPFGYIYELDKVGRLTERLKMVKMGQYERISTAFRGVSVFFFQDKWLPQIDVSILECVKGIGMKTARFFAMHTRPNQEYACLDTHILRWLGEKGHIVPKTTPRGEQYLQLEKVFLSYCRIAEKTPAELDLDIWNSKHEKVDVSSRDLQVLTKV